MLILIGAVIAFFAFGLQHYLTLDALKTRKAALDAYRGAHPFLLAGGFFIGYVLVAAFSVPGAAILTLAGGAFFGVLEGTLLVSFASAIGATLAMLSSRFIFRDWVRKRFGAR
ncbi:MAG: pyridine nucleotide-disulfide oxidoreductase, partial [Rhodanobacteraceae bacterium]